MLLVCTENPIRIDWRRESPNVSAHLCSLLVQLVLLDVYWYLLVQSRIVNQTLAEGLS